MNRVGLVLGKFLPPHRGHVYLCEFAAAQVETLYVVVGTLAEEPIDGALRYAWMRQLLPGASVLHLTDENPQTPDAHPDFWRIWRESLLRVLPCDVHVDLVFASEPYGERLAKELGATFVPVDLTRTAWSVSGTEVRASPLRHWQALPRVVRPYFAKRVSIFGPESTGKTTLARDLATEFNTRWVPEYARGYLERQGGEVRCADMLPIARGQAASEASLARDANKVLLCDTDPLLTIVWARALFGDAYLGSSTEAAIEEIVSRGRYDLTLVPDIDVPFVPDPVRYLPGARARFLASCRQALDRAGRPYVVLSGSWRERQTRAREAVAALLVDNTT